MRVVLVITSLVAVAYLSAQPLAFPGAEGFGRFVSGGRGGRVIEVTSLDDSGPGTLRAALTQPGPRTVVFRVGGTITLLSPLVITCDSVTVAGQTAPGDGICIRGYPLIVDADNVIIRYIRVRMGDLAKTEGDALSVMFRKDIIIDHCSFSWATDEVLTVRDNENTTVQWCIIAESLNRSYHHKGSHGYGGIWGGKGASFHHNLLAHHASRNPRFNGSRYHGEPERELVDFRNNVIYNWGEQSAYGGEGGRYNVVGNYYKYGPATRHKNRIVEPWSDQGRWYIADNYVFGFNQITEDNWAGGVQGDFWRKVRAAEPFVVAPVTTHSAEAAYALVLAQAGAVLPRRDQVDERIIQEVRTGTARFGSGKRGIIDSQEQVGGWPELRNGDAPADSDHDGMPDVWELARNLNPNDPADGNADPDGDGYTNLEDYFDALCHQEAILRGETGGNGASDRKW
ncbi:MAG: pectate lyase [candidate division KSB1 bacterium]|nr:pectate lyase [candidate division KSB1 bacterium]MDZ7295231.1 pectate lyase [candidate division KSB1 bacterium]MDZ7338529.1 pectate lyase [candidate division KSB1 bacterium]MDZ7392421.1 pectate lyase [candidate division KSB1 bacterium]MDZ7412266.1 pectate lyase [candidate division KSB1 bacterium]